MSKKSVSISDVEHVAKLSRIRFNDNEKESFRKDLQDIVSYFEILSKVDTSKITSFSKPTGTMRDDVVKKSYDNEDIIKNAPEKTDDAFIVPRVVE